MLATWFRFTSRFIYKQFRCCRFNQFLKQQQSAAIELWPKTQEKAWLQLIHWSGFQIFCHYKPHFLMILSSGPVTLEIQNPSKLDLSIKIVWGHENICFKSTIDLSWTYFENYCNLWAAAVDWMLERFWRRVIWFVFCILEICRLAFLCFPIDNESPFLIAHMKFQQNFNQFFIAKIHWIFLYPKWHKNWLKSISDQNFWWFVFFILIPKMTNSSELWNHLIGHLMNFHWNWQFSRPKFTVLHVSWNFHA